MKTPEDEAFDDLAKRQGAWGGGYPAKRAMAADKLQGPVCDKDPHGCWNVRCQLGKQCKNLAQPAPGYCKNCKDYTIEEPLYAQPAQESANYLRAVLNAYGPDAGISLDQKSWSKLHASIKAALAQPEQEPANDFYPDYDTEAVLVEEMQRMAKRIGELEAQRERVVFPTMLRKMWSGGEVQAWLDENVNKEKNG